MRVPIENKGQMPIYVAGTMIPPGETRHFEDDQLPPEFRAAPVVEEAPVDTDPLPALLEGTVAEVSAALADLADEALARLETLETEGKNRKGVIEAIAAERLRRAELKSNPDGGAD